MEVTTETKACSRCGSWHGPKPLEAFDRDSRSADKRRSICRQCRKEERLAQRQPPRRGHGRNGRKLSPNDLPRRAKKGWLHARNALAKSFSGFWLCVLFVGGFGWSSVNGTFAFLGTARILSADMLYMFAFIAAGVLTLGTALTAHWSVKFFRLGCTTPAFLLVVMFFLIQSLNMVVNLSGVHKRLALVYAKQVEASTQAQIEILEDLKIYYQQVIDKYPLLNEEGDVRTWKREHTLTVKATQDSLTHVQAKIATMKLSGASPQGEMDRKIVMAWLVLPELCMLAAVLVFSFGPSRHGPNSSPNDAGD